MADRTPTASGGASRRPFIVAAVLLATTAVILRPGLSAVGRYFSKERIELRRPLDTFDEAALETFRVDPTGPRYETRPEDIGTEDWVFLPFRDRTVANIPPPTLFFVTYYSDPRDQVPHTPEVCYRQGGSIVTGLSQTTVATPGLGPETPEITARLLRLRNQEQVDQVLIYAFCCNGRFYDDREKVRLTIGLPGDKYIYFSKIEVTSVVPDGDDEAVYIERCQRLMAEVLPELVDEHFPRREDLRRK